MPCEINIIKRFASWNDFPKSLVNSIINKTLDTPSITTDYNDATERNNGVTIYFCVQYYGDKGCSLIKFRIRKTKSDCKKNNSQLSSEFYMTSLKLISSVPPKIKRQQ